MGSDFSVGAFWISRGSSGRDRKKIFRGEKRGRFRGPEGNRRPVRKCSEGGWQGRQKLGGA